MIIYILNIKYVVFESTFVMSIHIIIIHIRPIILVGDLNITIRMV